MLEGWDPTCKAIVEKTPSLVDWKLVYRDPLPKWISSQGRTALLGDSAHPFLPTSAQGATQAMEDGVTIAICLRRAGKDNIAAALRTHEEIRQVTLRSGRLGRLLTGYQRYERVKAVQKTGESTRDMWHKTDWSKVRDDPSSIALPREDWIHTFDAEKHAEEVFDEIFQHHARAEASKSSEPIIATQSVAPTVAA